MKYLKRERKVWEDYLISVVVFTGVAFVSALVGAGFVMILWWIG